MNVPTTVNIDAAVAIYYAKTELTTSDICSIFDCSETKARQLKKAARMQQDIENIPSYNARAVNTEMAYRVWGLNVKRMERAQSLPKIRLGAGG